MVNLRAGFLKSLQTFFSSNQRRNHCSRSPQRIELLPSECKKRSTKLRRVWVNSERKWQFEGLIIPQLVPAAAGSTALTTKSNRDRDPAQHSCRSKNNRRAADVRPFVCRSVNAMKMERLRRSWGMQKREREKRKRKTVQSPFAVHYRA